MGCTSCGTSKDGKPSGCKSNGGCSSGGCNRLNVYDWLANLPFSDPNGACKVVEVSFNHGSRKEFLRNNLLQQFEKGDMVAVEGVSGFDVGMVNLTGEMVRLQLKKKGIREDDPEMKKILRKASDFDMQKYRESKDREPSALQRARSIALQLKLNMKLIEVEIQADGRKATFFYTADDRVDFRELIKIYASEFRVKVEMKQIGARQEAAKLGGIGSCGRELCCSTWLTEFKSVTTTAARYQNLSINQTKLSGQCGRLKCCLNYELDTYLDALQHFPDYADTIEIARGTATLVKKDIFKDLMWYVMEGSNKQYPLTISRVKEIKRLNREGIKPDELQAVEIVSSKPKEVEPEFVDVVGHISLSSLERNSRKRNQRERDNRNRNAGGNRNPNQQNRGGGPQGQPQQNKPQQQGGGQQLQQNKQGGQPQQQRGADNRGSGGNRGRDNRNRGGGGGNRGGQGNRPPNNNDKK
jgi:cell fate regulator YaaT (PSP1 superfamily)